MRRTALTAALVSVAAALAVGCGGGSPEPDLASGLTPTELLRRSAVATLAQPAYRITVDGRIRVETASGADGSLLAGILGDGVDISGEGPINGDALSLDLSATLTGLAPIQANVTKVGGQLFAGLLGTDYRVDLPAGTVAALRPGAFAATLIGWASKPSEVAREELDGVATVRLAATIDLARASSAADAFLSSLEGSPAGPAAARAAIPQLGAALEERSMEVWIGTADLLPRKAIVRVRFAGPLDALPQVRAAAVDLTIRLNDFGDAVPISAPTADELLDLDRLRSLAP